MGFGCTCPSTTTFANTNVQPSQPQDAAAKDSNVSWREVKDRTLLDVKNNARRRSSGWLDEMIDGAGMDLMFSGDIWRTVYQLCMYIYTGSYIYIIYVYVLYIDRLNR